MRTQCLRTANYLGGTEVLGQHAKEITEFLQEKGTRKGDTAFPTSNRLGIGYANLFGHVLARPAASLTLASQLLVREHLDRISHIVRPFFHIPPGLPRR